LHITYRQLQVFSSLIKTSSYAATADKLCITQAAVYMQMKLLQEQIPLSIIEKINNKITPTDTGLQLFEQAQKTIYQFSKINDFVQQTLKLEQGSLSLSVVSTAGLFATRLLKNFVEKYPKIKISLSIVNQKTMYQQLEENLCDLVIMGEPFSKNKIFQTPKANYALQAKPFMENPLVIIAPFNNKLIRKKPHTLSKLSQEKFVVREAQSGTRLAIQKHFKKYKCELKVAMEMNSGEAIKQSVAAGLGLGIVSQHTIEWELEAKKLSVVPAESFPIKRQWFVAHLTQKKLSPIATEFYNYTLQNAHKFVLQ